MWPTFLALAGGLLAGARVTLGFQSIASQQPTSGFRAPSSASPVVTLSATIAIDENVERDVYSMEEWAANCGVQRAEGFQLISEDGGNDFGVMAALDLPAGSPVLFVPSQMILSSNAEEYGEQLALAEDQLGQAGLGGKIPLFRLFIKVLAEYKKGDQSPYHPWLNSLPRRYNNGASMTYACFDCLPPYVALLSKNERVTFKNFHKVIHLVPFLDDNIVANRHLIKFAYNVAVTRSFDVDGEKRIVPMADMVCDAVIFLLLVFCMCSILRGTNKLYIFSSTTERRRRWISVTMRLETA
uniref:SET domain-containing protein n=1 Tax=Odontella aurita TaxID=265563 RepID=A0A7S4NGF0_9STRA|mmetsp:Transcript_695/g.2074  ORF Transcript_695/g.2074 Transcript_695/m.2074 type:complete len:298 (+) Transcript_695:182-1075(+)